VILDTPLDQAWARQAPQASFGLRQRWLGTARAVRAEGWPLLDIKNGQISGFVYIREFDYQSSRYKFS